MHLHQQQMLGVLPLAAADAQAGVMSQAVTCRAAGGIVVTPGNRGHGPKSYRLQKECAESGATNTKHNSVCFNDSSRCSKPMRGLTS